jgi:hypothetical protein
MSIQAIYDGPPEVALPNALSDTSLTDIYTAGDGDNSSVWTGMLIANDSGSAVSLSAYYHDGSTDHLVFKRSIPANDTEIVSGLALRLRGGYKIKAQAVTGGALTLTAIVSRTHRNAPA